MSDLRYGVLTTEAIFVQKPKRRRGKAMIEAKFRAGTVLLVEEQWNGYYCVPVSEPTWETTFLRNWYGGVAANVPIRWLSPLEELAMEAS